MSSRPSDNASDAAAADVVAQRAATQAPSPATVRLLAGIDPSGLSGDGTIWFLQAVERAHAWLASLTTDPISQLVAAETDPADLKDPQLAGLGRGSVTEEIRVGLALSRPAAAARVEVAEQLTGNLRPVQAALAAGDITYAHARLLVEELCLLDPAAAAAVATEVLPKAAGKPLATLRRAVRRAVAGLAADQVVERHEAAAAQRSVCSWHLDDGMAELRVVAPAPDIQMIWQVLTILAGAADTTPVTDPRPIGARRVDALTRLCLEAVAPGGPPTPAPAAAEPAAAGDLVRLPRRPHIPTQAHIVVDLPTLAGLANHPAELVGYGPVPADIARAWLADATSWRRLVTDPATDQLIDLGPVVYRPPPGLDAYVRARDGTCTFPFCHQPAHRCDLDHAQPHQADGTGGHTSAHNLGALCRYHHRIKTFMGWTPHIQPDRTVIWESPTGRTYHTHPPQQAA